MNPRDRVCPATRTVPWVTGAVKSPKFPDSRKLDHGAEGGCHFRAATSRRGGPCATRLRLQQEAADDHHQEFAGTPVETDGVGH